jgi:pimeloyl-ACP methyl ester carboxylesterase
LAHLGTAARPLAAAGFRVVSVDMPGWGKSQLRHGAGLSRTDAVETVRQILDELGVETAVLLGKSWGGGVALETAVMHPARVSKLILSAPAYSGRARLTSLRQPVLLAWAEDDEVIPLSQAAWTLSELPDAQLVTFPTGGHSAAPNNAAAFAPQVIRFLQNEPNPVPSSGPV